jgi:hypothetical protein
MKIYKMAQGNNFQMIPQNPSAQSDPNVQLQNMQNSQQALQTLGAMTSAVSELMAKVADVEDTIGITTNLRNLIEQQTNQAIMQTEAYQLLSKMGILADTNILKDPNKMSQLQVHIQRNITDYASGLNQQQTGTQGAMQQMGYPTANK